MQELTISTRTDLDFLCYAGKEIETYVTYIIAESTGGLRLVLNGSHIVHTVYHNHEFYTHETVDIIKRLTPVVNKIQAHINAGGKLDLSHWSETDPDYGSNAYCNRSKERARVSYLFA